MPFQDKLKQNRQTIFETFLPVNHKFREMVFFVFAVRTRCGEVPGRNLNPGQDLETGTMTMAMTTPPY